MTNGALDITSSTADTLRIRDGAQGTNVAELGFGSAGVDGPLGATDRAFGKNATLLANAIAGDTLTFQTTTGNTETVTFGFNTGEASSIATLTSAINGLTGVDASATGGVVTITGATAGETITVGGTGTANADTGLTAGATTANERTLESTGLAANDSFIVSVDGTDYTPST